jgi:hypothetical protein
LEVEIERDDADEWVDEANEEKSTSILVSDYSSDY